mgnify:CR=1 FL=1
MITGLFETDTFPTLHRLGGDASNQLHFDFVSGGNMKPLKEPNMRSLTLTFVDDDHVKQE